LVITALDCVHIPIGDIVIGENMNDSPHIIFLDIIYHLWSKIIVTTL